MELNSLRSWGREKHPSFMDSIHPCYEGTLFIGHLMFLLQGLWWSSGRTYHFTRYGGGVLCHHLHAECHWFKHTHSHWAPVFVRDVVYLPRDEWLIFKLKALLKRDSNHLKWSSKHDSRIHKWYMIWYSNSSMLLDFQWFWSHTKFHKKIDLSWRPWGTETEQTFYKTKQPTRVDCPQCQFGRWM